MIIIQYRYISYIMSEEEMQTSKLQTSLSLLYHRYPCWRRASLARKAEIRYIYIYIYIYIERERDR